MTWTTTSKKSTSIILRNMTLRNFIVALALVLGVSQASVIKTKSIGNCRKLIDSARFIK